MKKTLLFSLLCAISTFIACKNDPKNTNTATEAAKNTPRSVPADLPEQNFDFGKFPSKWFALSKKGNDLVVMQPCDVDNRELRITNDNGHYQMFENMGDDGIDYDILEFKKVGAEQFTIKVRVPQNKKEQTFDCAYDPTKGTATWKWRYAFGSLKSNELVFVDADHLKNFKQVAQVCE
jgi:hypothetical protein